MKKQIKTEITIHSSSAKVWEALTAFEEYPKWNPFITSISGRAQEGHRLKASIGGMNFSPVVKSAVPNQSLTWLGSLFFPGLFDGLHSFRIEALGPDRSKVYHEEKFNGILLPLLWGQLEQKTLHGFEAMNQALKKRVEG